MHLPRNHHRGLHALRMGSTYTSICTAHAIYIDCAPPHGLYMDCKDSAWARYVRALYGYIWTVWTVCGSVWINMDCIRTKYRLRGPFEFRLVYGLWTVGNISSFTSFRLVLHSLSLPSFSVVSLGRSTLNAYLEQRRRCPWRGLVRPPT